MVVLNLKDKEFSLVPRTRKVVALTESLKTKNLNDLIFNGLNEGDTKVLAEIIKAFAEYEDGKAVFTSINTVYDFIDDWKMENGKSYTELYIIVAEVVNEMGFFKTKMSKEELEAQLKNPVSMIDIQELARNSAQRMIDQMAEEEFRGYQG